MSIVRCRMRVVTICLPESYVEGIDVLIKKNMYPSRSEVIRIAIRDLLVEELWKEKSPFGSRPTPMQGERTSSIPLDRVSPVEQYRKPVQLNYIFLGKDRLLPPDI